MRSLPDSFLFTFMFTPTPHPPLFPLKHVSLGGPKEEDLINDTRWKWATMQQSHKKCRKKLRGSDGGGEQLINTTVQE